MRDIFPMDTMDAKILNVLQKDASIGLDAIGDRVGLSRNGVWRRVRALEDAGIIKGRVALLDADRLGLGLSVFVLIRTNRHDAAWTEDFRRATRAIPEILGAYRMTGELDYLIHARVADMAAYDRLYQRLTAMVEMSDVSASFVMEELKETTAFPL